MEHLNSGDGSIISQLKGLNDTCPIRFTWSPVDTMRSAAVAVDETIKSMNGEKSVCALTTVPDKESLPVGIVSGTAGIPLLSASASSDELNNRELYPRFARTVTDSSSRATASIDYFCNVLDSRYLVVTHEPHAASIAVASSLVSVASRDCPDMVSEYVDYVLCWLSSISLSHLSKSIQSILPISVPDPGLATEEEYKAAALAIKSSGYRYIHHLGTGRTLFAMMEACVDIGCAGVAEYLWTGSVNYRQKMQRRRGLNCTGPCRAMLVSTLRLDFLA